MRRGASRRETGEGCGVAERFPCAPFSIEQVVGTPIMPPEGSVHHNPLIKVADTRARPQVRRRTPYPLGPRGTDRLI